MSALTSIFEILQSDGHTGRSSADREKLKELWVVANQAARISKRQTEINVVDRIGLLLSMGDDANRVHVDFIFGSMSVYGNAFKGVCIIYLRQVDCLLRDCEAALFRKLIHAVTIVQPVARVSVSSRRRSTASRRSSFAAVTITPENPPELDFDSIMDLDALCDELNRRTLVAPSPQQRRVFAKKRSRSNSCSSSTSNISKDQNPFEPLLPLADDIPEFDIPFIVTPETPPVEPKKEPLIGYDPKVAYTSVQWARFMRDPPPLDLEKMTPLSYILASSFNNFVEYMKRPHETPVPRRRCVRRRPLPANTPEPNDNVSVVGAVDGDYDPIDELRGFDAMDDDIRDDVFNASRVSIGGVSDRSSRRMSIASELLHKRRDSFSSVNSGLDFFDDDHSRPVLDEPSVLKNLIREELEERGKKTNTLLSLEDVCPIGHTARQAVVKTISSLLILASQGDVCINREMYQTFSNVDFCFSLKGDSESSE
jgi:hypothetical protein